jgi:hypothetical protein
VVRHLKGIDALEDHGPNTAMVSKVQEAVRRNRLLTTAKAYFMRHELTEFDLMAEGIAQDEAHQVAGKTHPTYANYDPEVVRIVS